jgi:hypothetical protein
MYQVILKAFDGIYDDPITAREFESLRDAREWVEIACGSGEIESFEIVELAA